MGHTCRFMHALILLLESLLCMAEHLGPNQPHLTALIWLTTVPPRYLSLCLDFGRCLGSKTYVSCWKVLGTGLLFQCLWRNYLGHPLVRETCRTEGLYDLQGHPLTRKSSPHLPWSNPYVLKAHHPAKNMVHAGYKMTTLDKNFKKPTWGFFQALGSVRK